jgi:hypothetical protein
MEDAMPILTSFLAMFKLSHCIVFTMLPSDPRGPSLRILGIGNELGIT